MEYLLENLINHISSHMPELMVVDEDYGQVEMLDDETKETYPLTYPAVLIDTSETAWSNIGPNSQKGQCTVRVRLVIDCYDDTHAGSGTTYKIQEREELRRKVHTLLQGHRIDNEQALTRISSRTNTGNHLIKIYDQVYTVTITETIERDQKTMAKPTVRIKIAEG